MITSMAASAPKSFESRTGGALNPASGGAAPTRLVLKNVGAARLKSPSARIRSHSTEPTMPRQPTIPTLITRFSGGARACSEEQFLGGLTQVIARAHRVAIGARGRDQQHVALARHGQLPGVAEHVGGLADRADDLAVEAQRFLKPRQV